MDESGSVKDYDFVREKNFVKELARSFEIGPNGAQVGVITFSTQARMDIPLNKHSNLQSLQKNIDAIQKEGEVDTWQDVFIISDIEYYNRGQNCWDDRPCFPPPPPPPSFQCWDIIEATQLCAVLRRGVVLYLPLTL